MGQVSKGKKRVYLKISIMKYNIWILTFRKASRKGLEINMLTNENCAISFPWEKKSRRIILRFRVHSRTFYDICVPKGRGQEMRITQSTTLCGILQLAKWPFGHPRRFWSSCLQTPFLHCVIETVFTQTNPSKPT